MVGIRMFVDEGVRAGFGSFSSYDGLAGELDGGVGAWRFAGRRLVAIPLVGPSQMAGTVLDVRQENEFEAEHVSDAVGALLAGLLADLVSIEAAIYAVAALTAASGVVVTARMHETHPPTPPEGDRAWLSPSPSSTRAS